MDIVRERELNVPIFQKQNLIKRRQFDDHSYKNRPLRKGFFPLSKGKSTNCNLSFSFFIFISICSSFYS